MVEKNSALVRMENATRQLPTLTCIVLLLNRQLEKNDLSRKITNEF